MNINIRMKYFVWFFMLFLHTSCSNSKSQSEFNNIEIFNNSYPLTEFELDVDSIDLDLLHKHHGDIPTPILLWIGGFDYIEFKTSDDYINGDSFVQEIRFSIAGNYINLFYNGKVIIQTPLERNIPNKLANEIILKTMGLAYKGLLAHEGFPKALMYFDTPQVLIRMIDGREYSGKIFNNIQYFQLDEFFRECTNLKDYDESYNELLSWDPDVYELPECVVYDSSTSTYAIELFN